MSKKNNKTKLNYLKLVLSIFICLLAGFIGSIFTTPSIISWYQYLNKPFFNPPNWLFAPVWTILYILMGITLYLILDKKKNKFALIFFSIQLILNTLWSILFFGLKMPTIAYIEIIILWLFILLTILYSHKLSKTASYIMIPYLLWVTFASFLNLGIWILN